jgi:hypothetical protein
MRDKPQWRYLLRLDFNNNGIIRQHKDQLLAPFFSNENVPKRSGGYTLL